MLKLPYIDPEALLARVPVGSGRAALPVGRCEVDAVPQRCGRHQLEDDAEVLAKVEAIVCPNDVRDVCRARGIARVHGRVSQPRDREFSAAEVDPIDTTNQNHVRTNKLGMWVRGCAAC